MTNQKFKKIALIGIGLIGSSLSHAIRKHELAEHIAISTRSESTLKRAQELKLGDSFHLDSKEAVKGADLIILCIPVGAYEKVAQDISQHLETGSIVTDVGSVKGSVIKQLQPNLPANVHLIPGHPVAGTEYSGPDSGFATLFQNRWCILTPAPNVDKATIERLKEFWITIGSNVEIMDPEHHDIVLAMTSHLPHLIAYNIVGTAEDLESVTQSEVLKFSASGFRDFTRIAASDPEMWRDVFLHNKDAVLETLGRFSEDLSALQKAIRSGDGETLFELFSRTRDIRKKIIDIGQDVDIPNFGRDDLEDEA